MRRRVAVTVGATFVLGVVACFAAACGGSEEARAQALRAALADVPAPASSGSVEAGGRDGCAADYEGRETPPFLRLRAEGSVDVDAFEAELESAVDGARPFGSNSDDAVRLTWTVSSGEGPITVDVIVHEGGGQLTAMGPDDWC